MGWKSVIELPESGIVVETELLAWGSKVFGPMACIVRVTAWQASDRQLILCVLEDELSRRLAALEGSTAAGSPEPC